MNEADFSLNERCLKKIAPQFALVMVLLSMAGFFLLSEVNDLLSAAAIHLSMAAAVNDIFQIYVMGGLVIFISLAFIIGYLFFARARAEENLREAMEKLKKGGSKIFVQHVEKPLVAIPQKKFELSFVAPDAEILVVDDDAASLLMIQNILAVTQIKVDTALSGIDCLGKLTQKHYDLIFLDQLMPTLDGLQTLEMARALEENLSKDAPVIAFTAVRGLQEVLLARGFTDYLCKPVDPMIMEKMLLAYLPLEKVHLSEEAIS